MKAAWNRRPFFYRPYDFGNFLVPARAVQGDGTCPFYFSFKGYKNGSYLGINFVVMIYKSFKYSTLDIIG